MKEKKILDALNGIDDELIEEANPQIKKADKKPYFKWITVAACMILAIGVGFAIHHINNIRDGGIIYSETEKPTKETTVTSSDENFTEESTTVTSSTGEFFTEEAVTEIAIEGVYIPVDKDFWKNLSIDKKYSNVSYRKSEYYNNSTKITGAHIGEKIGKVTATGTDPYNNEKHTKEVTIYEIKTISSDCAVAVKFEEDKNFFVYVNRFCTFETLGEITEKLSLDKNLKVVTGYYREDDVAQIRYDNLDNSVVLNMLRSNKNLKALKEPNEILLSDILFEIQISPVTSSSGNTISVSKNGYLLVNVFHTQHIFFVGKENAEKIISSVTENYKGKKLVATTEPPVVYNSATEEIPLTEVFSDCYKP